jgi:hypothetical protein
MEFYSATKKNEIFSFTSNWMGLENITLSKVSQAQKAKNHIYLPYMQIKALTQSGNIIGHGSHTKGRMLMREIGEGKEA